MPHTPINIDARPVLTTKSNHHPPHAPISRSSNAFRAHRVAIEQQQPAAASVVPNQMPAFPPGSLTVGSNPSNSTEASPGAAAPDSPAAPGSCTRLSPEVAANFTNAVSEALNELGVASVEELQRERFKLFDQGESSG